MKKSGLFLSMILLLAFIACNQGSKEKKDGKILKPVDLKIEKVDGVWKVINLTTPGKAPHVKQNGIIRWSTNETDVYIQFPDTIFTPVGPADILKHGYLKHQKKGTILRLKVKNKVEAKTYIYAVFCTADSTFAQEDSPPKIIVVE